MNKLTGRDEVHKELLEYHRLKRRWGQGHIKIKLASCALEHCEAKPKRILHENMRNKHMVVLGSYLDSLDNTLSGAYLGHNLKEAHARLDYILRFHP